MRQNINVLFTLKIAGAGEPFRVVRYQGFEAINDGFGFEIHIVSEDPALPFADMVGQDAHFIFGDRPEK